jgi:prolipoprotein diacylglyceryltransferase
LAVLVSGRIFYFLEHTGEWGYSLRYGLEAIIFSANYHLSLIGCILGFLAILFLKVESFDLQKDKYLDIAVISFLFASWVGWIGGFIGETIYGANTTLPIGISYNNPITTVPLGGDLLPLGIIYAFFTFLLFFTTYTLRQTTKIHGLSASV